MLKPRLCAVSAQRGFLVYIHLQTANQLAHEHSDVFKSNRL